MFVNKYYKYLYILNILFLFSIYIYIIFYNYKIINFWYKYKNLYNFILLIFFLRNLNLDKIILFASGPQGPSHGTDSGTSFILLLLLYIVLIVYNLSSWFQHKEKSVEFVDAKIIYVKPRTRQTRGSSRMVKTTCVQVFHPCISFGVMNYYQWN